MTQPRAPLLKPVRGQIATFLIILMAAVLVMAMFISNLGQLSNTAVEVANAADGAALSLGSQLASRANDLCKAITQMGDENATKCDPGPKGVKFSRRTGMLGLFLAIAAVVAGVLIIYFSGGTGTGLAAAIWHSVPAMIGVGAGLGAAGGAIGGGIAGTGAWAGALQGASIGAGIGGGVGAAVAASGWSAAGLGTLAAAGPTGRFISDFRQMQDFSENTAAVAKSLSGLPDYERMREQTLLQAMSQAIDDPNRTVGPGGSGCYFPSKYGPAVGDPFDVNNNGDTTESISCLDYWWSVRVNQLKASMVSRTDLVKRFIEGPWNGEPVMGTLRHRRDMARRLLFFLERSEVECQQCQPGGPIPSEGRTVELWRRLYNASPTSYQFPKIFQPGPDQQAVRSFMNDSCDPGCPGVPVGWDSLDAVRYQYGNFLDWADSKVWNPILHVSPFGSSDGLYRALALTTDSWMPKLYNPKSTNDEYHRLDFIRGETDGWFVTARYDVVPKLPDCHLAYGKYPEVTSSSSEESDLQFFCENAQIVVNKVTGRKQDLDPIDNCTFVNNSSPSNLTTGPHFPNMDFNTTFDDTSPFPGPLCKIGARQRDALTGQLDRLEQFVKDLPNYIQANSATYFDNLKCFPPPLPYNDTRVVTQPEDIKVQSIDQIALNKWPKPKDTDDKLEFMYTFQYECQNCVTDKDKGVTDCDPDTTYPKTEQRSGESIEAIGTLDLAVASQDGVGTAQGNFLKNVDELRQTLAPGGPVDPKGKLDDEKYIFGTTDADLVNEFAEGVGGEVFIGHSEPHYVDAEGEHGKAALQYFLEQVKSFHDQMESALSVPLAVDGRLPNPAQPLNDVIGGGTRPVDGRYSWQDSRGVHTVTVDIGPFIKASTEPLPESETGNWLVGHEGVVLVNYCDNDNTRGCPYRGPDRTWVRIKRQDPSDQAVGWWKWNPFGSTITKAARVSYGRSSVKLCGTGGSECP